MYLHMYMYTCIYLQLFDKVKPGIVNWDKANKPPYKAMGGNMKKLENLC